MPVIYMLGLLFVCNTLLCSPAERSEPEEVIRIKTLTGKYSVLAETFEYFYFLVYRRGEMKGMNGNVQVTDPELMHYTAYTS